MTDTRSLTDHTESRPGARLPNSIHAAQPWRIQTLTADFALEDVWRLPVEGGADDFDDLVAMMTSGDDLINASSWPARLLWTARDRLGDVLSLGRIEPATTTDPDPALPIPGSSSTSLRDRLPTDLRDTAADVRFDSVPFSPLFRTNDEFAAEMSNRTVHAVMHLAWVADSSDCYHGEMAVYVKPRGILGQAYMGFIKPFRYLVVYPALMSQMERAWNRRTQGG